MTIEKTLELEIVINQNKVTMSTEITKVVTDQELTTHLENLGLLQKLTKGEKNTFIEIAKAFNLNPFKREIHVSKYGENMSIITGYEVYIKRAERTGLLDGWSVTTTGERDALKAILTIYRKDRAHPFIWEALYKECVQKTKEGIVTKFWQKADFMTKKVAISQGFRLCFSDELGGMPYTADELQDTTQYIQHEVVAATEPIQPVLDTVAASTDKAALTKMWKALKPEVRANPIVIEAFKIRGQEIASTAPIE